MNPRVVLRKPPMIFLLLIHPDPAVVTETLELLSEQWNALEQIENSSKVDDKALDYIRVTGIPSQQWVMDVGLQWSQSSECQAISAALDIFGGGWELY